MQNCQVQSFRPPILVRRSYATGVMERAFPFGLSFRIVCHISLSVLSGVSDTRHRTLEISRWKYSGLYRHGRRTIMDSDYSNTYFPLEA